MKQYYITFRSVTYAQKGETLLKASGIPCSLRRTPRWMEAQGCGYCLHLWTKEPDRALELLEGAQIPRRRIYCQGRDGQLEEMKL